MKKQRIATVICVALLILLATATAFTAARFVQNVKTDAQNIDNIRTSETIPRHTLASARATASQAIAQCKTGSTLSRRRERMRRSRSFKGFRTASAWDKARLPRVGSPTPSPFGKNRCNSDKTALTDLVYRSCIMQCVYDYIRIFLWNFKTNINLWSCHLSAIYRG